MSPWSPRKIAAFLFPILLFASPALADDRDEALLDILLSNGSITQEQYDLLSDEDEITTEDLEEVGRQTPLPPVSAEASTLDPAIVGAITQAIEEYFPVKASYGSKGFRLETKDGNWQTNLQWRAQFRLTWPTRSDPRSVGAFGGGSSSEQITFQARRLRMKIGGHGYRPWLKYYFEVDLQPTRDTDDSSSNASARVIDYRIDVQPIPEFGIRVGQWKIDYNRERVDSSGRQQFVERSIVNRIFTIDRQMGVSFRGHLFAGVPGADLRYAFGIFTGEGRGVANDDNNLMYTGRIQWNFLGRDLKLRQTDVERTEKPTASLAIAAAKHSSGVCTRWSSGGCGNLDGFVSPTGTPGPRQGQYRIHQALAEFAFKWQGWSIQSEGHWKQVIDRALDEADANHDHNLYGLYFQTGYFWGELIPGIPKELELAFRYAIVREPNSTNRLRKNTREEYTAAANWFFAGHNNKLTLDYSFLTLDDDVASATVDDHRVRLQWDVSF